MFSPFVAIRIKSKSWGNYLPQLFLIYFNQKPKDMSSLDNLTSAVLSKIIVLKLLFIVLLIHLALYLNRTYTISFPNNKNAVVNISHDEYIQFLTTGEMAHKIFVINNTKVTYFGWIPVKINYLFYIFYLFLITALVTEQPKKEAD
ncbi:hypothetical protein WG904_11125 [Pedobacter sp. Du54]|uniref:hypothetical protein n=1 Tax=Pedobacter anseongensis TaxID=3133439 RepID=UPI00309957D7